MTLRGAGFFRLEQWNLLGENRKYPLSRGTAIIPASSCGDVCACVLRMATLLGGREEGNSTISRHTSGFIGLLTGPHQTFFEDSSSFTIRLSDGDLPVLAPEYADKAPEEVIADPVSYTRASS